MAKTLRSPWLAHQAQAHVHERLESSLTTDVVIVGAGIAGIATAYFTLRDTKHEVIVVEAARVAHGATGHNAGQLVSYFERPFHELVDEFGLDIAVQGQHDVYSAWELLAEMQKDLKLKTPCLTFTGYAGIADIETLLSHLDDALLKHSAGITTEQIYVSAKALKKLKLPRKYRTVFLSLPHQDILDRLESKDQKYIALLAGRKGCINSAAFTAEVALALLAKYPDRFNLFENTAVSQVELFEHKAIAHVGDHQIRAKRLVLCTNGFENFSITNRVGGDVDTKFHHLVRGSVGYMAAFLEQPLEYPTAISYLPKQQSSAGAYDTEPYFYLTRRPYAHTGGVAREDLVCVGGPEFLLDDTRQYSKQHVYPDTAHKAIDAFLKKTYRHLGKKLTFKFFWHGLMGYTPNGIRCVGAEPCNPVLLYNLGCNGVGILPSIYGGLRTASILRGQHLAPSMFDPQDQRCLTSGRNQPLISHRFLVTSVVIMLFLVMLRLAFPLIF
jgi:glycine/D-amino acid oxidase-like deaminating enzyme